MPDFERLYHILFNAMTDALRKLEAGDAAILAAKILATSDEEVLKKLKAYSEEMKETVQKKAEKLDEIGYQAYLEK